MKLNVFRRILKEDFDKDNQPLVEKLAYPINLLMESIVIAFNKNIDFDNNIKCQIKKIDVAVLSNGNPQATTSFPLELTDKPKGIICLRTENLTNSDTFPSGAPFVSFSENQGNIIINNIKGIQANDNWRLTLLII